MLTIGSSSSALPIVPNSSETPITALINEAQQVIKIALAHIKQAIEQKNFTFAEQRLEILLLEPCWRLSPPEHKNILSYLHDVAALSADYKAQSTQTQSLEQKFSKEFKPEIKPAIPITMTGEIKKLYDRANSRADDLSPTDQIHFYQAAGDNYRKNHAYFEAALAYTEGIWIAEYGSVSEPGLNQALWERLSVLEQPILSSLQQSWFRQQGETTVAAVKARISQLNLAVTKETRDVQYYPVLLDFLRQISALLAPLNAGEHVGVLAACYTELEPYLQQWVEVLQTVLSSETAAGFSARFDEVKPLLSCWMIHRWHPLAAETVLKSCDNFLTAGNKVKAANEPIFIELLQYSNLMSSALLHPEPQTLLPEPRPIAISTPLHAKTLVEARKLFIREKEHPNASAKFTQTITEVLNRLIEECVAILGEAPCGFCVLGVGSLARGELCLRSDIDIAFLIDNADYRNSAYFSYLVDILQTKLRCLGESNGICIDEEDIASIKLGKLVHTPESYVATYMAQSTLEQDVVLAYKLLCVKALWSNPKGEPLLERYQQLVAKQLDLGETKAITPEHKVQGMRYLKIHQSQWQQQQNVLEDKSSAKVDLKKDYLQPLLFWCLDIALYFGLTAPDKTSALRHSVLDILTELEARHYIHPEFIKAFREAWQTVQQLRTDLHHASILHLPSKRRHNLNPDEVFLSAEKLTSTTATSSDVGWAAKPSIQPYFAHGHVGPIGPTYSEFKSGNKAVVTALSQSLSLSVEQQAYLIAIHQSILEPAYQTLDELQQASNSRASFDPMYAWFNRQLNHYKAAENVVGPKKPSTNTMMNTVTQVWAETLCQRNASVTEHLASYKRLPDAFKETYYTTIKRLAPLPALLNSLAAIPFKDGVSFAYTEAQTQWQTFLSQQLTAVLSVEEKTPIKELAKQYPKACLVQWLDSAGKRCSRLLHTDVQIAWERTGYLSRYGFDLKQIKAAPNSKAETGATKIDGRGYVFPILEGRGNCLAYAKLYPEMPGRQALAESLAWHLSGYGPMSTLCKVTHLATGQVYPLLISQFRGETLQNHLRDGTLTTLESALDKESFTLKFLETLLLSYEDDKFDNLSLEPFINRDGKIAYRLISFDADRAFADPFIKEELTEKNILRKQVKINAKSVVYCLEAMTQNLHPDAVNSFKEMQPLTFFTHWLQEPLASCLMGRLFSQTEAIQLSQNKVHECFIPAAFEVGTVSRLYQRFLRIQAALNDIEPPQTHLELMSRIEPHLASFYERVLQKPMPAKERFDQLPTHYTFLEEELEAKEVADIPTASITAFQLTGISSPRTLRVQQTTGSTHTRMLKSITIQAAKGDFKHAIAAGAIANPAYVLKAELIPAHNHYQAIQAIRQALINGNSKPFLELKQASYNTDDLKAQVLKNLNWSALKPKSPQTLKQLQGEILNALVGGKYYHLSFINCTALTNDKLTAIIKDSLELQVLDVSGCSQLSATPIRALATPHSLLRTLNLSCLPRVKYLSHVNLRLGSLRREPTNALMFPQLRRLNVSYCRNLSVLQVNMPLGKQLSLENCTALDDFSRIIALLFANESTLTALNLPYIGRLNNYEGPKFFRTLAAALSHNRTLTELHLGWNDLSPEGARVLAESLKHNCALTALDLNGSNDGNNLGPEGVRALAEMLTHNRTLAELHLGLNNLGPEGTRVLAESLKHNRTLTALFLWNNSLGFEGARALAEMLAHNRTLVELNLIENNLGPEGALALAGSLKHNSILRALNLYKNNLGSEGARALAEGLKHNRALIELDLGCNELGLNGAKALAEVFKYNRTLTKLVLESNNLYAEGAKTLAETLKHNHTLTSLDLGWNELGSEGVRALAEVLTYNRTLIVLNLSNNKLGSAGVHLLAEALEHNRTLTSLDLQYNNLGPKGIQALAEVLKHNHTLTKLILYDDELKPADKQALEEALDCNRTLAKKQQEQSVSSQSVPSSAETKSAITPTSAISTSSETKAEKRRLSRSSFFEPAAAVESTTESKAVLLENTLPIETQPASPATAAQLPSP